MPPSVLLGVLSGSQRRRWAANLSGAGAVEVEYLTSPLDVEGERARDAGFLWMADGSPALRKQMAFLRRAWARQAAVVALAEDDAYVNVRLLAAAAMRLLRAFGPDAAWHAGSYEWYNYQPHLLRATGFGGADRPMAARYWGQTFANCSGAAFDARRDPARRCVGPLMFPKGPLHAASRGVLRWLHESGALASAERRLSIATADGRRAVNDVEFGFELVQATAGRAPLHYVSLAPLGWIDKRGSGPWTAPLRSDRLLAAHRLPFACWAAAERAVRREAFAPEDYELTEPHSPIDTSTGEAQHWLHPPTATLRSLRRAGAAPRMRAAPVDCG